MGRKPKPQDKGIVERAIDAVVEAVTPHHDAPEAQDSQGQEPQTEAQAPAKQAKKSDPELFKGHPKFDKFGGSSK